MRVSVVCTTAVSSDRHISCLRVQANLVIPDCFVVTKKYVLISASSELKLSVTAGGLHACYLW